MTALTTTEWILLFFEVMFVATTHCELRRITELDLTLIIKKPPPGPGDDKVIERKERKHSIPA